MGKKKRVGRGMKVFLWILCGLLVLILALASTVAFIAGKNMQAMNGCIDAVLQELNENYTVTQLDPGEYDEMNIYGIMKFDVEQYDIENIGNLSIMRVNMGVMQMATVVITPQDKNLPLLSADYMYILSNRKAYLEFYDVVEEKDEMYLELLNALGGAVEKYEHLEEVETTPAWYADLLTVTSYKGGGFEADEELEQMLIDSLSVYLEHGKKIPTLSVEEREQKLQITVEYTDGLIEKGGISTDVFKSALGSEETKRFFDQVFFGTAAE